MLVVFLYAQAVAPFFSPFSSVVDTLAPLVALAA
jgi:hypothetical protein